MFYDVDKNSVFNKEKIGTVQDAIFEHVKSGSIWKDIYIGPTDDPFPGVPVNGLGDLVANYFLSWFEGTIIVPESGSYSFYLSSDDGSRFFIDGNPVSDWYRNVKKGESV
jgi:hypothetical protein